METVKVGIREFREKLAGYLESGTPLAIMRHGETLGYYIPARKRSRKAELEAMKLRVLDLGTQGADSVDYPDFADAVAAALRDGRAARGVVVCGTGIGITKWR